LDVFEHGFFVVA